MDENACLIGLRSGEYGGRKISLHSGRDVNMVRNTLQPTYGLHLLQEHELLQSGGCYNCQG
jgi:hypothetical protein